MNDGAGILCQSPRIRLSADALLIDSKSVIGPFNNTHRWARSTTQLNLLCIPHILQPKSNLVNQPKGKLDEKTLLSKIPKRAENDLIY